MPIKADPGGFPQRKANDVPAVSTIQMREIQRIAQEDYGFDILQIMENAGRSTARLALEMLGGKGGRGQRIVILLGGGNKGGAGMCAARLLANWGFVVDPVFGEMEEEMSFTTRRQAHILKQSGLVEPHDRETSERSLATHLADAALVIDALVGYGLEGPPAGMAAALTDLAVQSKRPILALDVPTGINGNTGEVSNPAILATTTLILDLPKKGVLAEPARRHVGTLYLADLGIPRAVHESLGIGVGNLFSEGPIVRLRR
jgi:NAD(P)H-hydrate epimerase